MADSINLGGSNTIGGYPVVIGSPTDGQELVFNSGQWENATAAGGGDVTASGTLNLNTLILGGGTTVVKATTTGTNVVTALGVNVGSAGAFVVQGGALGTPSSGVATNLTGTAASLTAGAVAVGGITGLGSNVATFLATASSANLRAALTDETGTGVAVFADSPTFVDDITIAAAGVKLTGAGGKLTILGLGSGADEDLVLDFDTTAQTVGVSSNTGVNLMAFGEISHSWVEGSGLKFAGGGANPITMVGGDQGGDTAVVIDNAGAAYAVLKFPSYTDFFLDEGGGFTGVGGANIYFDYATPFIGITSGTAGAGTLEFLTDNPSFATYNGLVFPNELGTPGVGTCHLVRLGGTDTSAGDDVFLSMRDGQAGTDDTDQGRHFIQYGRVATALLPVSGVSNVLAGFWWDGAVAQPRTIELENKVQTTGIAEFWIEELTEVTGYPFVRMWRTADNDGIIATYKNSGDILQLGAYDNDGAVTRAFLTLTAGNTPTMVIAPPSGGTVTVQASTFKSSDGSTGATGTGTAASTLTIKNGLVVNIA